MAMNMAKVPYTGERVVAPSLATECHRGVFGITESLPFLEQRPTLTYEPLRGPVWTITDGIYRTIAVEGRRGLVAFDTFYSPGAALSYRHVLNRALPDKPIEAVVYSHDHLDHTGYADDLAPGVDVIAHEECAAVIAARDSDGQARPTQTWSGERWQLELDGVEATLINPGPTHGNGNVAALFPDQGLLFMVDTVIPGVGYTFFPDWHVAGYTETMRTLLEIDGWDLFVPGHFWPLDRAGFVANLDYFDAVMAAGADALTAGVDPDDLGEVHAWALRHLGPQFGSQFRFQEYAGLNLMRAMAHVRTGGWGPEDNVPGRHDELPPTGRDLPSARRAPRLRSAPARNGAEPASGIDCSAVADGLWTVADGDHRALFAVGERSVVALNTLGSPAAARAYRAAVAAVAGERPIETVILTNDHLEHAGYVAELAPGATVVAHADAAAVIRGRALDAQPPVDREVDGPDTTLALDGVTVRLLHPGPSVGSGNLAVHFPRERVLFLVGVRADARYGIFPDAHLGRYPGSLRPLLELDVDVVVPGRGRVMTRAGFERALDYLDALHICVQRAFQHGVPPWDVRALHEFADEWLVGTYGDLDGFEDHVGAGAVRFAHYYLMGGWGLEDGRPPREGER